MGTWAGLVRRPPAAQVLYLGAPPGLCSPHTGLPFERTQPLRGAQSYHSGEHVSKSMRYQSLQQINHQPHL